MPKQSRLRALALCSVVIVVGFVVPADAQSEFSKRLKTIPLDPNAAELKEFKERTGPSIAATPRDLSALPKGLFFAVINPAKDGSRSLSTFRSMGVDTDKLIAAAVADTVFDERTLGYFHTRYGPPLDLDFYCDWRTDPAVDEKAELRRNEPSGQPQLRSSPTAPPEPDAADLHINSYGDLPLRFKLAGRPCTLKCNVRENRLCTPGMLDHARANVQIVQLGE